MKWQMEKPSASRSGVHSWFRIGSLAGWLTGSALVWMLTGCGAMPPQALSQPERNAAASAALAERITMDFNRAKLSYLSGDYELARQNFLPLARAGHAESQYALGYMLFYGQGGEMDLEQAHVWMQMAAEQGNPRAFRAIARINQARQRLVDSPD